eukprot:929679-Ditylum_brightwellii.AAC.1
MFLEPLILVIFDMARNCIHALPTYRPEWDLELEEVWIYCLPKITLSMMQRCAEEDYWKVGQTGAIVYPNFKI